MWRERLAGARRQSSVALASPSCAARLRSSLAAASAVVAVGGRAETPLQSPGRSRHRLIATGARRERELVADTGSTDCGHRDDEDDDDRRERSTETTAQQTGELSACFPPNILTTIAL